MSAYLVLRFDAPLMSFGGTAVDQNGVTDRHPGRSLLTGLCGNALGYDHRDFDKLERLQERLVFAARCDHEGTRLTDFQTVDLSQEFMQEGWTTAGTPEGRAGGDAKDGTHIRYRDYLADTVYTLVLTLRPEEESPSLAELRDALANPERPLFIGRKPCLPSVPLLVGQQEAGSLLEALRRAPVDKSRAQVPTGPLSAWWPELEGEGDGPSRLVPVNDERNWQNQVHVGGRLLRHGVVQLHPEGVDER